MRNELKYFTQKVSSSTILTLNFVFPLTTLSPSTFVFRSPPYLLVKLFEFDDSVFLEAYVLAAEGGDESRPDLPFLPLQPKDPAILFACCDRLTKDEEPLARVECGDPPRFDGLCGSVNSSSSLS